jgi:hypothetical protein
MNGYQIKVIMCGSVYRTSPPCYHSGKWMWVSVLASDSKQKCRNRIVYLFCVSVYDKKYNILVNNGQMVVCAILDDIGYGRYPSPHCPNQKI